MKYVVEYQGASGVQPVWLPYSKSIVNRLAVIYASMGRACELAPYSSCMDTDVILRQISSTDEVCDVCDSGTALRFLLAYFAARGKRKILTGSARLCQRPVGGLVDALLACGAAISYLGEKNCAPLRIGQGRLKAASVSVDGQVSSQFVSALLLAAPISDEGLEVQVDSDLVSASYVDMTVSLMRTFGVDVQVDKVARHFVVKGGGYSPARYEVERDWSAAAYWYAVAALVSGVRLVLPGLSADSLQGDCVVGQLFSALGVETRFDGQGCLVERIGRCGDDVEYDMRDYPDLVPPLVFACLMDGVRFRLRGVEHLAYKESNRIAALTEEAGRLGFLLDFDGGTLSWDGQRGRSEIGDVCFDSHDDHRIAMSLAISAVRLGKVTINNPECVQKSYPGFWDDLRQAGFSISKM